MAKLKTLSVCQKKYFFSIKAYIYKISDNANEFIIRSFSGVYCFQHVRHSVNI